MLVIPTPPPTSATAPTTFIPNLPATHNPHVYPTLERVKQRERWAPPQKYIRTPGIIYIMADHEERTVHPAGDTRCVFHARDEKWTCTRWGSRVCVPARVVAVPTSREIREKLLCPAVIDQLGVGWWPHAGILRDCSEFSRNKAGNFTGQNWAGDNRNSKSKI